jgi:alcohol dehydrogenase class IV
VLRWNEKTTIDRQMALAASMKRTNLADAVAELIKDLGLPVRLRDVDIKEAQLPAIAEECAKHPVVLSNPRSMTSAADVMEILRAAW